MGINYHGSTGESRVRWRCRKTRSSALKGDHEKRRTARGANMMMRRMISSKLKKIRAGELERC
jgi:hypothetical protein